MNTTHENTLDWQEDFDDHDNTTWEASSFYVDANAPFNWRITQFLEGNQIKFSLLESDAELLENFDTWFSSPEDAKADALRQEREAYESEEGR